MYQYILFFADSIKMIKILKNKIKGNIVIKNYILMNTIFYIKTIFFY